MRLNTQSKEQGASNSGRFRPGFKTTGTETPYAHVRISRTRLPALSAAAGLLALAGGVAFWTFGQGRHSTLQADSTIVRAKVKPETADVPSRIASLTSGSTDAVPAIFSNESAAKLPGHSPAAARFEVSRQLFLKNAAFQAGQGGVVSTRQPVPAGSPGSTLTNGPRRIAVEATVPVLGFSAPALEIVVTGNAETDPQTSPLRDPVGQPRPTEPTQSDIAASAEAPAAPGNTAPPSHSTGFTHEEELFRTRWGWAAFNEVQRAALGTAHETE